MSNQLPKPPSNPLGEFGTSLQASLGTIMNEIDTGFVKEDESREEFYSTVRKFYTIHDDLLYSVKYGMVDEVPNLLSAQESTIEELLGVIGDDVCARESKLGAVMEKSRAVLLLHRFFQEGRLATQASLQPCNDNEYIGAVLTFAQLLNEYALGRACEGDAESIELCLSVVSELNGKMLEFDFRNGPLRRKYDGLKYAVRNIEDVLFELSLQGADSASYTCTDEEVASPTKRMRLGEYATSAAEYASLPAAPADGESESGGGEPGCRFLDAAEMDAIRTRLEHYDQQREQVIKDSRDVQKLAKQAVYAVIRGQQKEAKKKLEQAAHCAEKILLATVSKYPTLRQGSFSNSLEEWAEGAIALEWVANRRIPSPAELGLVNSAEYVGALADFTGEIGRLAVMLAGKRDFAAVQEIHQAELVVSRAISRLSGNRFGKKLEMVNQNAKKVGDVVYELRMLQRSGRQTRTKVDLTSTKPAESKEVVEEG